MLCGKTHGGGGGGETRSNGLREGCDEVRGRGEAQIKMEAAGARWRKQEGDGPIRNGGRNEGGWQFFQECQTQGGGGDGGDDGGERFGI